MTSSENFASIEPWMFRSAMGDTWLADYIARDAETLTKALQKSFSATPEDARSPFLNLVNTDSATTTITATPTPTVSSLSGSDQDSAPKRQRVAAGKIPRRKSRASKRSQTTFITADPANFRQMVQQVTGVRFGAGSNVSMAPVMKPEPHRAVGFTGGRLPSAGAGYLPTLDTSAFLLDQHGQHQQQTMVGSNSAANDGPGEISGLGQLSFGQPIDDDAGFGSAGLDFETFSSCFPTLESSWKVM
ncbi:calmodulin-binding protein 25 [Cicer arietinum]|uniref:Calmodulin-binding protein 25 n=1 Tax=Cicer arietinum TaxID=3827 RepID=A0A1S2XRB7_CICAR|nr:calmodulin-binding protein 25 [Cicer arietinum]